MSTEQPPADVGRVLITGATGLVGAAVARRCVDAGYATRALVRETSDTAALDSLGVEKAVGALTDAASLVRACDGVTHVVHCAAKVGDWGPVEDYRRVNVEGLSSLIDAALASGSLRRFVHISSLGVYEARDHHGTDETEPPNVSGIDGYTLTKAEAERLALDRHSDDGLPVIVLRPGFVYGPEDRTVIPRIAERLRDGKFAFLGSGDQLMNNVYSENIAEAVMRALAAGDDLNGEVFNVTDGRLVTKQQFIFAVADGLSLKRPAKHVPLPIARLVAKVLEGSYRLLKKDHAPILSQARIKFLGLNLDFSSEKARKTLGYDPPHDFEDGMATTMKAMRERLS